MRSSILMLILVSLVGCDFIGGGETIVRGNNNLVGTDSIVDRVAAKLAKFETTPTVIDDDLKAIYTTIRRSALEGDLSASLDLLKVAAIQRKPEKEDE